ncbi:MAG TPA: hypothetical protein VHE37_03285 [Nevskiaceae bacterium]|nr:hypothetical protein [Nevskiaceae bacterium]
MTEPTAPEKTAAPAVAPAAAAPAAPAVDRAAALAQLRKNALGGASWFWWIAALSAINSVMIAMNSDTVMALGLGITEMIDIAFKLYGERHAEASAGMIHLLHGAFVFAPIAIFYAIGRRARAGSTAAIKLGMILYALDAAVPILSGDGIGIGFHGLVLFFLWRAHGNTRLLKAAMAMNDQPAPTAAATQAA